MPKEPDSFSVDVITVDESSLPDTPDVEDEREVATLESEQINFLKEQNEDLKALRALRRTFAERVYWFMAVWAFGVFLVLFFQGFGICGFELQIPTITTLVGGTTISVVGLVGFIVKGLFPGLATGNPQHIPSKRRK